MGIQLSIPHEIIEIFSTTNSIIFFYFFTKNDREIDDQKDLKVREIWWRYVWRKLTAVHPINTDYSRDYSIPLKT